MIDAPRPTDPADVLAQPTRARLFALLGELRRPAGTAELAERLQLHPNGVRLHLERLQETGLVTRARLRNGRGRPPDLWTIAPEARPGGEPPHAYGDLGRWLARALQAGGGLGGIRDTGHAIGRELAPDGDGPPLDTLVSTLTSLGFQPTVTVSAGTTVTVCLRNCPYRDAVHENQPAICTLHRGVTEGLLDALDAEATLSGFVANNPDTAHCLLEIEGLEPDAQADAARSAGQRDHAVSLGVLEAALPSADPEGREDEPAVVADERPAVAAGEKP